MRFNLFQAKKEEQRNFEQEVSYVLTPEMELYTAVVTSALSDQFYEKVDDRLMRLRDLIAKVDPVFVVQLAIYARNEMHLRSIPLVLAVELAKMNSGNNLVQIVVKEVVQRADEITELLAYYQLANERTGTKKLHRLAKQLQKGLAEAFNRFDEYQFAKYNRNTEIKLRDALFLIHPKAKSEEQQGVFNRIAMNELALPYTWETELSALGQVQFVDEVAKARAFKLKWEELIASGKLGYMAMLRNLRNIVEAQVSTVYMLQVCKILANEDAVRNSKQLPFRFLAAYHELKFLVSPDVPMLMNALEDAIRISIASLKGFDVNEQILVACDVSGSMQKPISARSKILLYDIGLLLGMLLQSKSKRVITGIFGDRWKVVNMNNGNVLANVDAFYQREGEVGYATNGYKVIEDMLARKVILSKVMFFTDCQMWDSTGANVSLTLAWKKYKQLAPQAKLYLFDLAGYGQAPISLLENDVYLIAGWSEKVFDVLEAIDKGADALSTIKKIELA